MILTSSERHFQSIIADGGSISVGSSTGASLYPRGLVELVRSGRRYGITQAGIAALPGDAGIKAGPGAYLRQ